jgi:ADP-heptose:LPS heptosyltransferase
MCTPLIQALKENGAATVDVIVPSRVHELIFSGIEYCDAVISLEKSGGKRLRQLLTLRKKKYDLLLYTFPTAEIGYTLMGLVLNARMMVLHDFSQFHSFFKYIRKTADYITAYQDDCHDIEQNLNLLSAVDNINFKFEHYPILHLSDSAYHKADDFLTQFSIAETDTLCFMHPGCTRGADFKRWLVQSFVELGNKLAEELNTKIFVILGPDELEYMNSFKSPNFVIVHSLNFDITLALLSQAKLLVSNDSGIMHAAALLQVPVVTLWGGTDIGRNCARGTRSVNILNSNIPCRPCAKIIPNVRCPGEKFECIRSISVQQVFDAIVEHRFLIQDK